MIKIRINKFVSGSGYCSRRQADELISAGRVFVNSKKANLGEFVDPKTDIVKVGRDIIKENEQKEYFAFYKPKGIITSLSDEQGVSIKKFLPNGSKLFPVGRLDKDTEGLLILTNDGEFGNLISHPSYNKEKIYQLQFDGKPTMIGKEGIIRRFTKGIMYQNKKYLVDSAKFVGPSIIELTIHEGRSRQIRIIAGKIGLEIKSLKRVAIGKLKLDDLKIRPGQYKKISIKNVI